VNLEHVLVDLCQEDARIGGTYVSALVNKAQAKYAAEGLQPPDDDTVKSAIFELVSVKALVLTDQKRLKAKAEKAKGKKIVVDLETNSKQAPDPGQGKRNPSGYWPIGPGDFLYNAAGDPVAVVDGLRQTYDSIQRVTSYELTVLAQFTELIAYEFHGRGEVLTATKTPTGQLAPSGLSDKDRYRSTRDARIYGYNDPKPGSITADPYNTGKKDLFK
jgi:hypothetical protein